MLNKQQKNVYQQKQKFIDKIAENMHTFGVSTTVGRVLGIIYMNREPMTLDDLSEATGMSKMRMSQVIRDMIDLNIAEQVFKKGSRKNYYNVETDYYQTFISLFTANWHKAVNKSMMFERSITEQLDEIHENNLKELNEEAEALYNELLEETSLWLEYYDWISRLITFFESGEVFEHVPKKRSD